MEEVRKQVLKLVRQGNHDAFRRLVHHYEHPVYQMSYIWSGNDADAESLANDAFLYAYMNMSNYFRENMVFSLWLFQIVACLGRNRICEMNREEMIHPLLYVSLEERITLLLYHVYHLSLSEIAVILRGSQMDIRNVLHCGREQLREKIVCEVGMVASSVNVH